MIDIQFFFWSYFWVILGSASIFFAPMWIPIVLRWFGFRKASNSKDSLEAMTRLSSTMKTNQVYFFQNSGATELTSAERTKLKAWVLEGLATGKGGFLIRGHSDLTGPQATRKKVAQKRGEVMKNLLLSYGVETNKVRMENCEDKEPMHPTNQAKNRRIEVFFIS